MAEQWAWGAPDGGCSTAGRGIGWPPAASGPTRRRRSVGRELRSSPAWRRESLSARPGRPPVAARAWCCAVVAGWAGARQGSPTVFQSVRSPPLMIPQALTERAANGFAAEARLVVFCVRTRTLRPTTGTAPDRPKLETTCEVLRIAREPDGKASVASHFGGVRRLPSQNIVTTLVV